MKTKQFIFGAVVGALVCAIIHIIVFRPPHYPPGPPPPGHMGKMLLEHFADELSLTQEQKTAVGPILLELQKNMMELRLSQREQVDKILAETNQKLAPILNAEQLEKLNKKRERMEEFRRNEERFLKEHGEGHMPPPPPPPF